MDSIRQLLDQIERFLVRHDMTATRFGVEMDGDRGLVGRMRRGRAVSFMKAERILRFMRNYRPPPRARAPRPARRRRQASALDLCA